MQRDELLVCLVEIYATVKVECPSIFSEEYDSTFRWEECIRNAEKFKTIRESK